MTRPTLTETRLSDVVFFSLPLFPGQAVKRKPFLSQVTGPINRPEDRLEYFDDLDNLTFRQPLSGSRNELIGVRSGERQTALDGVRYRCCVLM
jgi:hypothetical protein